MKLDGVFGKSFRVTRARVSRRREVWEEYKKRRLGVDFEGRWIRK